MSDRIPSFMRCVSFCTARSYDLVALANSFKRKDYIVRQARDVLYVTSMKRSATVFFFNYGSIVCWGFNRRQELKWVEYVKPYAMDLLLMRVMDLFCFRFGGDI